jgi:ATP-dependent DNA ligase
MTLAVARTLAPMEAEPVDQLPAGPGWQYEPKYDGFRCLVFKDGADVDLRSRNSKPLARYFPEITPAVAALPVARLVLDGELIIPKQPFDVLQLRLHPAASRIKLLAGEHPATLVAFDLLADVDGTSLLHRPFAERRKALAALFKRIGKQPRLSLARATTSRAGALKWLKGLGHGLDGIVAKRLDLAYQPGQRAMRKFKVWTTVDCVVGGLYLRPGTTNEIEFLLLGLYDPAGKLNYVGRARVDNERAAHAKLAPGRYEPVVGPGAGCDPGAAEVRG